jgi:alpha-glucosidase
MQWDDSLFGGFSRVEPWLPIGPRYRSQSVAVQKLEPGSLFSLYQRLLSLRLSRDSLRCGSYRPIESEGDVLLYLREYQNDRILVALNFSAESTVVSVPPAFEGGKLLISTSPESLQVSRGTQINLLGSEGVLIDLT